MRGPAASARGRRPAASEPLRGSGPSEGRRGGLNGWAAWARICVVGPLVSGNQLGSPTRIDAYPCRRPAS